MPARIKVDRDEFLRLNETKSLRELAAHFGVTESTVSRLRRSLGASRDSRRLMTAERRARIEAMLDDGWSFAEVQRTEGVHPETLRAHFPGRAWSTAQRVEFTAAKRTLERALRKSSFVA